MPWTPDGTSFGFGDGPAHLPQPEWFGPSSVEAQERTHASTLQLYRRAIGLRHRLQGSLDLTWVDATPDVVHFERPRTDLSGSRSRPRTRQVWHQPGSRAPWPRTRCAKCRVVGAWSG